MSFVPYGHQDINEADIEAVCAVLRSDYLTQGPAIERFEAAVAERCEARYAVAVSSATAALHLACLAAGLGPGDTLWTSPNTFVASANCALYCGAGVDFVDIDARTYNLGAQALETKLAAAQRNGKLPRLLVPVHFGGQSCDMAKIAELAARYRVDIIEDASHAIGGSYHERPVGCCAWSQMAVFSFHPVKIIATGEGGMVLTNSAELHHKLLRLRSHGITRDAAEMTHQPDGPWYYQQLELGYNYRMTDMQAALGASQMTRLDAFVARRRELAARYDLLLSDLPLTRPWQQEGSASSWHLYVIRLHRQESGPGHRAVFEALRAADIGVNLHYIPVHTQPYYQALGFAEGDFPEAERYYREAITLPLYYGLSETQQDRVVAALRAALAPQVIA